MKKIIAVVLALTLAAAFTGCAGSSGAGSENSSSSSETFSMPISYFGKVNSVAGNEIELNLAKEPETEETPDSGSLPTNLDGTIEAVETIPSTEVGTGGANGAAQRVEVEYTGEMKSFVIPGGMKIKDAMDNEKQMSDIKKGSVMNFYTDEAGNITDVFLYD